MTDPLMSHRTNGGGGCGSLSAGLTWPRRVRPSSLNFRPLRGVNPGQSPEGNMDPSPSFFSPPIQQRSGYVSPLKAVRTLKEYDQEIDALRKENFNLKLNLYFLERDMEKLTNPQERVTLKANVELRIEAETLRNELSNKATMLHEAMVALEKLEETHKLAIQRSKETQLQLEGQIEALKQELEKEVMQTPRSSEASSEMYRQAFGMEESLSGKSSPDHETSWEKMKSQYVSELEKMKCTIDEKDKEIKNMRIVIEDLEKKNKVFEEKVRRRNIAIQGLFEVAKKKGNLDQLDQPHGYLQKSLMQAIEAAHTGNRERVVSNMADIRNGLTELLSVPGSEVTLNPSEDVEYLKNEMSRKDEIIQTLEEQLIDQNRKGRSLEEHSSGRWSPAESMKSLPISSNAVLEQECSRLQKAVRQKDSFIQELLDERTKMTVEHEKTVQSLVSRLQNPNAHESDKIKNSEIYDSESLKILKEQICEKDAEIGARKRTIELLNFQLAQCQSELQDAITDNEEKEHKLMQLSSRSQDLERQLKEIQAEMRALKGEHQSNERDSASGSFVSDKSHSISGRVDINKPLIDFDESVTPGSVHERKHASLSEIKELQRSLAGSMAVDGSENLKCQSQHSNSRSVRTSVSPSPNLPSTSGSPLQYSSPKKPSLVVNKDISESFCVRTCQNETVRVSLHVSKKEAEKPGDLLDIMENSIGEYEQLSLLQKLEDRNAEIVKLERHASLQEDMASVLAEDKKRLQQEVEEKASEVHMLTASCSELENQVISVQSQLHSAVKRADELERMVHDSKNKPKTPVPKSSAASQTDCSMIVTKECETNTSLSDLESNLNNFGQVNDVNSLKGEICVLILMVEEKDKEINLHKQSISKLKAELKNMTTLSSNTSQLLSGYSEGISAVHEQLSESQGINHNLLQHLQEVARFMESLLSGKGELDVSSLTAVNVSDVIKHISDSIELSETLSQNLSVCEESKIFDSQEYSKMINESIGYPPSELLKSGRISTVADENLMTSSWIIEPEGSELQVVPHQQNADATGKSWKQTSMMRHKPAMEIITEAFDSDQLTILGDSCGEEEMCCLSEQKVPNYCETQAIFKSKACGNVRASITEIDMRKKYLSHMFEDVVQFEYDRRPLRHCWYGQEKGVSVLPWPICYSNTVDGIMPLENYQNHNFVPYCNISSDSDIWSEPDRNLSLQRIGIDLEAPSMHTRSPPKRRRSARDRQFSDDCSSDNSLSANGIPKGKLYQRRKKSIGSFKRDAELKLDTMVESRMLAIEHSIEDKLAYLQKLSQAVQDSVSGLNKLGDKGPDADALVNITEEINNLQSTLANAVEEVKVLKDTTQESSQLSQDHNLSEELKLYNEEILSKINDIDQLKEILVKERCARETAEQNLFACHRELSAVKEKLSEAIQKLQEKSPFKHDRQKVSRRSSQGLVPEVGHVPEESRREIDVDHLRRRLSQEEERNGFLSKQVNDIHNENKKIKIDAEQLQISLMNEQRNLEEIRQQLMSEQDIVKRLSKEKNAAESKSVDITADMMRLRASLTELQNQNDILNKQIKDLLIENKKMKLDMEESQTQLSSEHEQLEQVKKQHLHKQESLSQLTRENVVAENKIASLTAEVETLKIALSQKEDQNLSVNNQLTDLRAENWKMKKELEQVELRLRTEVEHLEAVRKAKADLHKQSIDLIAEKADLEKRLHYSEERMKALSEEKTDLSNQIFEEQRESKNLLDQLKMLESQKSLLEKEINKYKTEILSSDSVCDETKHDLKQTKEKLKKLELKLWQCENELSRVTTSNEHLMTDKKSLTEELESVASKFAELSKQNGDIKRMLKEKTVMHNEIEREKCLLLDQIESLKVKKIQAESSRDKLVSDYDSLAAKVDGLERQVRDSDVSLQKSKDEQEHLKQQATSLQNKIKLKESVVSELEDQHEVLREQLKDLQHSLNKNDIDLKHLEEDNHSLELQMMTLQKQLKKTNGHLDMKDDEIGHLQEEIFNLEQKIKDKETAQRRILDEKKASEEEILHLQQEVRKQDSIHKQLKQQTQEFAEQMSSLEQQLHSKEIMRRKSEEEVKALQAKVEEKEKSAKKLESSLKKMEHKLSTFQDSNVQLQQKVQLTETARKFSEDQTAFFREELNKMREAMLVKARKEEPASISRLSTVIAQLNEKEEYCKALENKVIEYQKQYLKLQREYDRVTTSLAQATETDVMSAGRISTPLIPSKVFSEPRSSQDYRLHSESKAQVKVEDLIKGLQLDNSDLTLQIDVLNKKLNIAEKDRNEVEEENVSLWKTLYGSQDEKTDIIKTLEVKNNDLKNQVANLADELESFQRVKQELEEENNSLRRTLYGKQDEGTDMFKRLEQRNKEFRDQLEVVQGKLQEAEASKATLREERDTLWTTVNGKKDEKTDIIKKLQIKNNEFKGEIEDLKKKLDASEKAKCDFEEEKNSLWKTLYGQPNEKTDVAKMLEGKNKELKSTIEILEEKLSHCEKAKADIEEKKNTLWKTLYGSQDEKTEAMKMIEEKNNELRGVIAVMEEKLANADKVRAELEEEKNSMWKTLCGGADEKTDLLQQMEMKNTDLKGEIETLKNELVSLEKVNKEMEEEKDSLWKTLYGSEYEKDDIIRTLEVKNMDLKGQVDILEKNLDVSEKVKKDLEERVNSLRVTLYGSQDEKADAVRSIELKNSDLINEVEHLKEKLSGLEKDKKEVEEEKASLWRTLCGNEDEKANVMRQIKQKNSDLSNQILVLEKKLNETEKTRKVAEEEKNSLWKTLYGSENEKSDMFKRLEQKNKALNDQVEELEKKLGASAKAQKNLEEEKGSLWKALHGSDDEKISEIKSLEMKNTDLKNQIEILEKKLNMSEKMMSEFEEEKNSLWKDIYGSQDEKAYELRKLNMEISDLKSVIKDLEIKLFDAEMARNSLEVEKNFFSEKMSKITEENANMASELELKDSDLKNQMEVLEEKLRISEELKKAMEEDRNAAYNQMLGDSSGKKLEGMLKETQIYANEVKKLQEEIVQKNALLTDMKEKLFLSENSLTTQKNIVEHLKTEISSYNTQLERAHTEREWFQNQYIDSQREVIRAAHHASGSEISEKDMIVVHQANSDLKNQVTELMSQLREKNVGVALPLVRTDLFAAKLPTPRNDKAESSVDRKRSSEAKLAELEKLHIEKDYLQKLLIDLKKQAESQPLQQLPESNVLPENIPTQRQPSDFSEDIAKQLASHGLPDAALREEMKGLQSERDYFKNLVNKLQTELQQYTLSLRDKGPASYIETENVKLSTENAELKSKLVQLHDRVKKREAMIKALSKKVVELSQLLKESQVTSTREVSDAKEETDTVSLLASQIVEGTSKTAEKSLSEEIVLPDIDSFGFDYEEDKQLLSLLDPSLRHSVTAESEAGDLDAKTAQKLRYQIEELENQLEDTKMDNYRLQEEVSTLLLKFGIQNNQLVCEKCGKSVDIAPTQPSARAKPVSKFTAFRRYLEKDPMFSKEESINKLGECKWKLQSEVLNMQKKLCINKPSYLENQESFNDHIAKIMGTEYPKIPVRIFSEPLLSSTESKDVVKNAQYVELLWKNQVLHLERDIRCLQNYRTFLEQFVLGMVKELTEMKKQKPSVLSKEQSQFPQVTGDAISRPTAFPGVKSGVKPASVHSLSFGMESGIPLHKDVTSQDTQPVSSEGIPRASSLVSADVRGSTIPEQTSSAPVLVADMSVVGKPMPMEQIAPTAETGDLQNRIKELSKKVEALQSENKKLLSENKMLSLECKKCYRSKRQLEKQIEDLKHSLKDMTSLNKSMELELDVYHQMSQEESSKGRPSAKHLDGYVRKSYMMNVLDKMKSLNSELDRLTQENSMLRKKLIHVSLPTAKAVKSRVLSREESSSDKESEGTVTLSRSGSLSSLDSAERFEMRAKKYERSPKHHASVSKHFQAQRDSSDIRFDEEEEEEHVPFTTTQRREKYDSIQDTVFHRSHFSSPDLGIESDPNHELFLSEQAESDEKSYMKSRPPKLPVSPTKTKPAADTITSIRDSVRMPAAEGASLHAMGLLKDHTLLRKEIEESLVIIKGMTARAQECVEYLSSRSVHPKKNPGYTTLKDILSSLSDINVCQVKSLQLVRSFWVSSVPITEENYLDVAALLQENELLLKRLELVMDERRAQKIELEKAFTRLREAQDSKQKMEKAIAKQLTRTKKVLKSAKTNLQGAEERPSYVPQKNNPSINKQPTK